jgi:hypothetical protein
MNREVEIMPGVWSPSFIGESQHATATHVVTLPSQAESLAHLRDDIRRCVHGSMHAAHNLFAFSARISSHDLGFG